MTSRISVYILMCLFLLVLSFGTVFAGMSLEGDEKCAAYGFKNPALFCGTCPPGRPNCTTAEKGIKGCPCSVAPPGGSVTAKCVASNNCKGESTEKGGLGNASGFQDLMKQALGMLQQLMQPKPKSPPPPPPPPPPPSQGSSGCTAYYQVTTPSSDPCAYYVPPTSQSLLNTNPLGGQNTASNELLNALNSGASSALESGLGEGESAPANVSDLLSGVSGGAAEEQTQAGAPTSTKEQIDYTGIGAQKVNIQSGTRGNIEVTGTGATVVAGARDSGANTEVAGFYGSDTFGGQPQGVAAKLCQTRPWSNSIVTFIIPPSFFDSLCAWRGYQVGTPAPPSPPVVTQQAKTSASPPASTTTQVQVPTTAPEVNIWAVPEKVSLGARTSVFWNTKGVESCTISSPDGSFNEHSLSGGAATVPLSSATVFTISCLTSAGKPVTDYVTVNIGI